MNMHRMNPVFIAAAGSFLLLGGAYLFQAAGYQPCKMCLWQRWPHMIAILAGVAYFLMQAKPFIWIGMLSALTTAGLGFYHTGVEKGWFEGPTSCSGSGLSGLSADDLLSTNGPLVIMCDQVSWSLMGLSMASWNAVLSLILAVIWATALFKR